MLSHREPRVLTSHCSIKDAEVNLSFPAAEILKELKSQLEKRLGKKGFALTWVEAGQPSELLVRVLKIEQGNQLLRYLVPFASPAVLAIEGEVSTGNGSAHAFKRVRKAHFGLFGGQARSMLRTCSVQLAKDVTKEVVKAKKQSRLE